MPVLFGDMREDGLIKVGRTLHRVGGKEVDPRDYPEGWAFDDMPEPPTPRAGINHIWLWDPKTGEHSFEEEEREWTQEELVQVKIPELEQHILTIERALLGDAETKGLVQKVDEIQAEMGK